jgi:hypothetical protein
MILGEGAIVEHQNEMALAWPGPQDGMTPAAREIPNIARPECIGRRSVGAQYGGAAIARYGRDQLKIRCNPPSLLFDRSLTLRNAIPFDHRREHVLEYVETPVADVQRLARDNRRRIPQYPLMIAIKIFCIAKRLARR